MSVLEKRFKDFRLCRTPFRREGCSQLAAGSSDVTESLEYFRIVASLPRVQFFFPLPRQQCNQTPILNTTLPTSFELRCPTVVGQLADYQAEVNAAHAHSVLDVDINICMRDVGALLLLKRRRRDKRPNTTSLH